MKRSQGNPKRRFIRSAPVRHAVAVEAARLLYHREFKEYYQAKREAARRHGCKVLPTNHEIHHQLLIIADATEGRERTVRLRSMRLAALDVMEALKEFQPRLVGSVWTGHIRSGSDIDINLYGLDPDVVQWKLEQKNMISTVERVRSKKDGKVTEFIHLHLHHRSGHEVEMTLYHPEEYRTHPTCSITGGPMARASLCELRQCLEGGGDIEEAVFSSSPDSQARLQSALLTDLTEEEILGWLPELASCAETPQNHYHHLDVLEHTREVVRNLAEFRRGRYSILGSLSDQLRQHLESPGPDGWSREALLVLAGLLHDIGKPETLSHHHTGRIRFIGHELVGAEKARTVAARLKLSEGVSQSLERMVALHMEPVLLGNGCPSASELHLFLKRAGNLAPELLILSVADVLSAKGPAQPGYRVEEQTLFAREMSDEFFSDGFLRRPNLPVSSTDLAMEFGVEESVLACKMLERLMLDYVDGEFQGREDGLARASELLETPAELW
jgi:putative nucleotidyltransferase with HDIG domain